MQANINWLCIAVMPTMMTCAVYSSNVTCRDFSRRTSNFGQMSFLAVWPSGKVTASINRVTQQWARRALRWMIFWRYCRSGGFFYQCYSGSLHSSESSSTAIGRSSDPLQWGKSAAKAAHTHFFLLFFITRLHDYMNTQLQHTHNNRFTALCPGLPGRAGTKRNTHPPTILIIIQSLSASSIYHDP